MKKKFPALFIGTYPIDVIFPDFPGCVSQGDDKTDALAMAQEALQFHSEAILEDGETVPMLPDAEKLKECIAENQAESIEVVQIEIDVPM